MNGKLRLTQGAEGQAQKGLAGGVCQDTGLHVPPGAVPQVREDVECAAAIHAQAHGVPLAPRFPDADEEEQAPGGADASAPPVDLAGFSALMEGALRHVRKPRGYLVPSPASAAASKHAAAPAFRPAINARSRDLASRLRPAELAAHEVLHHSAAALQSKLEAARKEADAQTMAECTFSPLVNPAVPGVESPVEGRAMRAARTAIAQGGAIRQERNQRRQEQQLARLQQLDPWQGPLSHAGSAVGAPPPAPPPPPHRRRPESARQASRQPPSPPLSQQAVAAKAAPPAAEPAPSQDKEPHSVADAEAEAAADMRSTEAMLLDLLASSSPGSFSTDDADVINQLHRVLVAEARQAWTPAQQQQQGGRAPDAEAGAPRRSSKDASGATHAVNLFVVPAAAQPQRGGK